MVRLSPPTLRPVDGDVIIESQVTGGTSGPLWFRVPASHAPSPESIGDALLPIGLVYAMATDGILQLECAVSQSLLDNVDAIQDILLAWHGSTLVRASVEAPARAQLPIVRSEGVAACFTGGVDSFYTFQNNQRHISSLVYVHGFDISLGRQAIYDATAEHLRAVASSAGKNLIELATNLKMLSDPLGLSWPRLVHGPALASMAMLLGRGHGTFLIPATRTYTNLTPWGSHPLIDPLWSTERVGIIHDGAESSRVQKVVALGENPLAQQHLRVCWKNTGAYNCGVCEKCYRTKIALRLAGTLERFGTFDQDVDLDVVRRLRINTTGKLATARENRDLAQAAGDIPLMEAIDETIVRYQSRDPLTRALRIENKQLKKAVRNLTTDVERLRAAREALRTRVKDLRTTIGRLRSETQQAGVEARRLQEEARRLRLELSASRSRRSVRFADALGRFARSARSAGK